MHRFKAPRRRHAWRLRITQLTIGLSLVVGLCASAFVSVAAHPQARANQRQPAATSSAPGPRMIPYRTPQNPSGMAATATRALTRSFAPRAGAAPLSIAEQTTNFNGLSDADQTAANGGPGFEVTPPDQGLCVGHDPTLPTVGTVVFEAVNVAVRETDTKGNLLKPDQSAIAFFHDPNAFSDPRCFYDATTSTFFFTIISFDTTGNTVNDVLVLNAHGERLYQFSSSEGGTCFGDQPHVGYDNNALYIATDQFCNSGYLGALLQVISKPQLVSEVLAPNFTSFTNLSIGGIPVLTLEPAISPHQNTEYLLNSFPFDANGNALPTANQLGLWQVLGAQSLTTGSGTVTLNSQLISSETYAFPVPATSTGNGSVTTVCAPFCIPVESEAALEPDDDRMLQTVVVGSDNSLQLWGALTTALTPTGDTATRDGAAWFKIAPLSGEHVTSSAHVAGQGYLAVKGNYLIYPAIYPRDNGAATMVLTMTSPTLNPSAAYAVTPFGSTVTIAALGSSPHMSFSDPLFGRKRWGDYSAVALDPTNGSFWEATEYIPPPANQDPYDNWGTRVLNIKVS